MPIVMDLVKSVLWKGADEKLEGLRLSHGWAYEVMSQVRRLKTIMCKELLGLRSETEIMASLVPGKPLTSQRQVQILCILLGN